MVILKRIADSSGRCNYRIDTAVSVVGDFCFDRFNQAKYFQNKFINFIFSQLTAVNTSILLYTMTIVLVTKNYIRFVSNCQKRIHFKWHIFLLVLIVHLRSVFPTENVFIRQSWSRGKNILVII